MSEPRTSILLPTRNRQDVIGYSIRSVLWQTDGDFELLIVGDGCEDNTAEVVASFADPRIRWFDLPKAPLSGYANRNIVLRQARGRYVAYAQDDDIMLPDHVERLTGTLEASGADLAYSRPTWVARDGFVFPFAVDLTQADQLAHFLNEANNVPSSCVAHRRDALERVGNWPEDVPKLADWRCWQRIIVSSASGRADYCATPTVLHFQASWKTAETIAEQRLRAIAQSGAWWPETCRIPVVSGVAEQETAFAAISPDPRAYAERLRRGVAEVVDRLAWAWMLPAMQTWPTSVTPVPPSPPPAAPPPAPPPPTPVAPTPAHDDHALKKARRRIKALKKANARFEKRWTSPFALWRQFVNQLLLRPGPAPEDRSRISRRLRRRKGR
jgi:hypothetical protein